MQVNDAIAQATKPARAEWVTGFYKALFQAIVDRCVHLPLRHSQLRM